LDNVVPAFRYNLCVNFVKVLNFDKVKSSNKLTYFFLGIKT